ncbi:MAG TPA: MarR family transcriptional regulator [Thermoleophilaceae bacterium]|nr:MarR family transcriptional regulator [Thermoleophilaceae bacterium]
MATVATPDAVAEASKAFFDLIFSERPPRIPRVASEFGLAPLALKVLQMLGPSDELPMGALAGGLCCDASNVTGIVDRLEQRGVIERRPDPDDRRVKRIRLTPEGERFREEVMERLYEPPEAIRRLTGAEQRQLRDLLHKALEGV